MKPVRLFVFYLVLTLPAPAEVQGFGLSAKHACIPSQGKPVICLMDCAKEHYTGLPPQDGPVPSNMEFAMPSDLTSAACGVLDDGWIGNHYRRTLLLTGVSETQSHGELDGLSGRFAETGSPGLS